MDEQQADAYTVIAFTIGFVTVMIGVLIWFIFLVQAGVKKEWMKHETCMVVTSYSGVPRAIDEVISYCGAKDGQM